MIKWTRVVVNKVATLVENACKKRTNYFGYGAWSHHIVYVRKFSIILAGKLKADKEVCELAALLHDYASVLNKNWYPKHHIHSARLAGEVLSKYKFPSDKIEKVKDCILVHRASVNNIKVTSEAKILASADAMAHFENVDSLLYLAYVRHKMDIDKGRVWVLGKLDQGWKKLIPEAKKIIKPRYELINKIFIK